MPESPSIAADTAAAVAAASAKAPPTEKRRVLASLKGLATGDAIGKQTENLSREGIAHWYPRGVRGFEGPPGTIIPRYVTNRKHQWRFGETTDDTERTLAVARAVLRDGDVRHVSVGRELLTCKKSVHPGLKSLWEFHEAADPTRVALDHNGCGAAIRVAPIGILYRSDRLEDIVERGASSIHLDPIIAAEKIVGYLLNVSHKRGGPKARLLLRVGYRADFPQRLESDLRSQHLPLDVTRTSENAYGVVYEIGAGSDPERPGRAVLLRLAD